MRVLVVDDEGTIRKTTSVALETMGHEPYEADNAASAKRLVEKKGIDVVFLDLKLGADNGLDLVPELIAISSKLIIVIVTAFSSLESAVEAIRRGAYDYVPKPFTPDQIREVFKKIEKTQRLEGRVAELESQLAAETPRIELQSADPAMQRVYEMVAKAAATPATILILGESGTGKSVLARAIHQLHTQKELPFVTVNCPSL